MKDNGEGRGGYFTTGEIEDGDGMTMLDHLAARGKDEIVMGKDGKPQKFISGVLYKAAMERSNALFNPKGRNINSIEDTLADKFHSAALSDEERQEERNALVYEKMVSLDEYLHSIRPNDHRRLTIDLHSPGEVFNQDQIDEISFCDPETDKVVF